ncbi:MAG: hypothetical protein QF903_12225 [Planctomycetota bacterium]|jgi:general secretion pathway protein D|nr:hypothetical protein [Planctomycetota bacterium]MDP6990228.1 hypothetical protein [Planctomycetota bacterium]
MRNSSTPQPFAWSLPFAALVVGASCSAPQAANWESESAAPTLAPAVEPGPQDDADDQLRQDAEVLSLKEQRKAFLVEQHVANAKALRERLRLEDARRELLAALEHDPDNLAIKDMLAEVGALIGDDYGDEISSVAGELNRVYQLRVQQLVIEAEDSIRKGKSELARGNYDAAIAQFTIALNHMRWAPYSIDWGTLDTEAAALLDRAKSDRSAAEEATLVAQQRAAYAQLRAQEESERTRDQAVLDNMLEQAMVAFEKEDYDDAMYFADEALRKDPRNDQAQDIRTSAFKAGRKQVRAEYVERKREQYAVWRERMDAARIPWDEVITLPDPDHWAEITELRASRQGLDPEQLVSKSERTLRRRLRQTTLRLRPVEEEESLRAVVDNVRLQTGLPLVVDPAAENSVIDNGIVFEFSFENEVTAEQILNLLADMAGEEVTWVIRHDAVLLTTTEKALGKPVVQHHDVRDLVFGLTDFMGPRIDRIRLLDEMEDEDGGGPFGGIGERPEMINIDDLATMIQENVGVGTWDDGASIESYEGHIIIVHTPAVQTEVRQFLEDLRRFSSSLVTIESKFLTVGDNWIQEVGVDFRGLDENPISDITNGLEDMASLGLDNSGTGASGQNAAGAPSSGFYYDDGEDGDFRSRTENFFSESLGDAVSTIGGLSFQYTLLNDLELSAILRAVEKSSQFELINDQVLSVHDTQRAYVTVINQRAYIQDFDVEVAQFQAVADPQVNILTEGVVLDVRPTIHQSRKYLTLEVQPTVAKVVALRDFSSTLGGNTSPVEFQLPELQVQSVFTTATIPDGGSILLGGLSNIRNVERRAEVPWLARVPLVGFLFKREGYDDENNSLMILIRAQITDVRDEVQTLETRY